MASLTPGLHLAQYAGIAGALWLAGSISSISSITMEAIFQAQKEHNIPATTLAQQWTWIFTTGKAKAPPVAVTVAASFLYLAWSVRATPSKTRISRSALYAMAACFTVGIVPFTFAMMANTNNALLGFTVAPLSDSNIMELLERWTRLNLVRSCLPLIGGFCGIFASFI